ILGLSRVTELSLSASSIEQGTNLSLGVMTDNLNETLGCILSTSIEDVTAQVYSGNDRTLVDEITLTDDDSDGNYTGVFTGLEVGDYVIDIEIEDSNETLEVCRNVGTFSVESEPLPTGTLDSFLIIGAVSVGTIAIITVVVMFVRKR
ncbi:MAG: hypothetical protein ACFFES_18070, partial [Candidatus Thorarchaeota archaeon]